MGISFEAPGQHDRSEFSSGQAELDEWFRHRAGQDERRNVSRVFVAVDDARAVVGFYSLSSFTLLAGDLPREIARKLPRYDAIPAVLIGRLARHVSVRGQGVGELLLADAIWRILQASQAIAVFAIVVDAKDEVAASFYEGFGFQRFPTNALRLFLPAATATAALQR